MKVNASVSDLNTPGSVGMNQGRTSAAVNRMRITGSMMNTMSQEYHFSEKGHNGRTP